MLVCALVLRVFLASLAVDLASRADRSMPPWFVGPSCLDIESEAPLTGDRTGVSGGCGCTVSCRRRGLTRFWSFLMTERLKQTEQERVAAERAATEEIFRLMRGDGNQSRINDGQPSAS